MSLCISKALKCGSWSLDPTRLSWCLTGEHTPSLLWQPVLPGNISSYIALQKESNISSLQEAYTLIRKNLSQSKKSSSLTLILHIRKSKMGKVPFKSLWRLPWSISPTVKVEIKHKAGFFVSVCNSRLCLDSFQNQKPAFSS